MAGREEVVHRIAAVARVGIVSGFDVFGIAAVHDLRLQNTLLLGQVGPQPVISAAPLAQLQIAERREVDVFPGQPRKYVRLVMDQTPAVHVPDHEGGKDKIARRRSIPRQLPGRQLFCRERRPAIGYHPPFEALQPFQPESLPDLFQ